MACPTRESILAFNNPAEWGVTASTLMGRLQAHWHAHWLHCHWRRQLWHHTFGVPPPTQYNGRGDSIIHKKGNLGTKTNISSAGGDILKRVPVTAQKHALIYNQSKTDYYRVHVSPGTYSSLWFQLVDWAGLEIDFNGADWSMVVGVG